MRRAIANYLLTEKIYESINSEVYKGIRESDNQTFIIKVLKEEYPSPQELTRYKQEYKIVRQLDIDGVIKAYAMETERKTLAIILEDFGASSLEKLMQDSLLPCQVEEFQTHISEFLRLAIAIAEIVGQIHAAKIIHKDINPSNIVLNPKTREVKIIDFGISTILTVENPIFKHPSVLEGTLAYISPEQTGRMNRSLDYRTDFYSLGVTFYELLTGKIPFDTLNVMELIHCQIAKQPITPQELVAIQDNEYLPTVISNIVMKLMAKTAEERYQSAWGLKADLQECLIQWEKNNSITDFSLGSQDIANNFRIPQKLYGRNREIEILLSAFETVAQGENSGTKMMLVAGYSGIGKSALVREIYKPITRNQGYFIFGKFNQFQRSVPYSAIVFAFRGLVKQLLTENSSQLKQWQTKLLAALGKNAGVIVDVIPEIELIIGKQPGVTSLGTTESQNRFNLVFRNFIRVFCDLKHPLVIFLDDLQWVDSATLKLIELMVTDNDLKYLFLIGSYRDNEVSQTHPLHITLEKLYKQKFSLSKITLEPLNLDFVSQILTETLYCDRLVVEPLAKLVMQKTGGNPFFVNQFLKTLNLEKFIYFDLDNLSWQWNLTQIEAMDITNNVVELVINELKRLPSPVQNILSLAACVGAFFDLDTLSIVGEQFPSTIFDYLLPAVQSGLILPLSELDTQLSIQDYKFNHDRIQQAAYALIEESQKATIHLQIGRLLLDNLSAQELSERLFEIVDHFNIGRDSISNTKEQIELARLNLQAGQKAKQATAYAASLEYINSGIEYLGNNSWIENYYQLTLQLYREKSELEYLNGNYEHSESLIKLLLSQVNSSLEKADIYSSLILLYTIMGKYPEALDKGRQALKLLSIDLPVDNCIDALNLEIALAKKNPEDIPIDSLINAPEMEIAEQKIAVKLFIDLLTPAYFLDQYLFALIATKCSNLCFQYGAIPEAAMAYSCYATILIWHCQEAQLAYQLGLLSLKISDRFHDLAYRCRSCNMLANHITLWVKHSKFSHSINDEAFEIGLESGDIQFVGFAAINKISNRLFEGNNLEDVATVIPSLIKLAGRPKNITVLDTLIARQLGIFNLTGKTQDKLSFHNDTVTEAEYIESCKSNQNYYSLCIYYVFKSQILYLYSQYSSALTYSLEAEPLLPIIRGLIPEAEHNYYSSLIMLALYPEAAQQEQQEYLQKVEINQKQLKNWTDNCPDNFLHKYHLVNAEIARIKGQDFVAMELYDLAIAAAGEQKFIQNEALGNELAARFWLAKHKSDFANLYLKKAHYGHQLWGAKRKVTELETKYPQLLPALTTDAQTIDQVTRNTASSSSGVLDLSSVIKASQALAGEMVLDKLLKKLMLILIENAGAQRGFLILKEDNGWSIEAEGITDEDDFAILQSIPVDSVDSTENSLLSKAIVNYVAHTQEKIVLNDASNEGQFIRDLYIINNQPKSILCTPLLNQGKPIGILYLENNLTTGAFTSERLEILTILSAQAAISIESSRLYSQLENYSYTLERTVNDRTEELRRANRKLERLANLDGLTQVANRRYFDDYFAQKWRRMAMEKRPLSLILFDVDFFKRYNDCYGHQAGDDCLIQVAQATQRAVTTPGSMVARYGGEEFVIVLPNTDIAKAVTISKSIQQELQHCQIIHKESEVSQFVTISIGLNSQIPVLDIDPKLMIGKADTALYMAKQQGRDRYCIIDQGSCQARNVS